ncbi:MAG: hypothetical protein KKD77_22445, partial [Gammaproteobacteria bacterium]|nr:hypothetical protein [Gammaproteobacteria bacterium]
TIRSGMIRAFTEGSKECGILPAEWTVTEKLAIEQAIAYENQWIAGFASAVEKGNKASGGKLGVLWPRSEIWIGRYEGLRDKAKTMTCGDRKLMWKLGAAKVHCSSCLKLSGKVKRASYWRDKGILPRVHGASYLECQGFLCSCEFVVTDEPMSKGPLPSLP